MLHFHRKESSHSDTELWRPLPKVWPGVLYIYDGNTIEAKDVFNEYCGIYTRLLMKVEILQFHFCLVPTRILSSQDVIFRNLFCFIFLEVVSWLWYQGVMLYLFLVLIKILALDNTIFWYITIKTFATMALTLSQRHPLFYPG